MNKTKIIIGIAIALFALASLFVAFSAFVLVPMERIEAQERAQQEKADAERLERIQREQNLTLCQNIAYSNYSQNWDDQCELEGKKPECSLGIVADKLNERYSEETDRCITLYK